METINIGYGHMALGFLLLIIPTYFLYRYRTGLVKDTLIAAQVGKPVEIVKRANCFQGFYKLDKVYPQIMRDLVAREAKGEL